MKKVLSFILSLILAALSVCVPMSVLAANDELKIAVATDIHIDGCRGTLPVNFPENELYFHASGSGNLYDEAPALTRTFLKEAAEMKSDFILISGDLTRSGTEEQHTFVANMLNEFEKEYGIQVYVVPGNHDYYNSTPDEFKGYYYNLGYGEAITVDSETASYTVDLPKGYRLIAVDSNNPGKDGDGMTDKLYSWIEKQVSTANADGKKIIYTMHHALLEHITLGSVLMKDFVVRNSKNVAEKFCELGIQYTFTGHEHGNDISKYTAKNGKTVYDILTTSLSSYPLEYRMVSFSNSGVNLEMKKIEDCDFDSLIGGYNEEQLALMKSDYTEYSYGLFRYAIEKKIFKYISPDFIKGKIKINDGIIADEIDALLNLVSSTLDMPIYDSGDGNVSIESLATKKGITLPKSDYTSLCDMVTAIVAEHYYGDEYLPSSKRPECELLVKGLNTGLEYILANAGKESLKALLGTYADIFSLNCTMTSALGRWLDSVGSEDSYKVAGAVLYPILDKFTVDTAPSDRNVTLPAIGETEEVPNAFVTVLNTILEVIKYILNVVIAII